MLGGIIGAVSFSGSLIAFGKLQGLIKRSIRFPGFNYLNLVILAATLVVVLLVDLASERNRPLLGTIAGIGLLAAMGPKMCALAGSSYDGAFFNWMTPEFAARARLQVEAGAEGADRECPPVFGYVRTAVGPDAAERLAKEESFYRDLHPGYRNHFDRLAEPEGTVGVAAADADAAQKSLAAYTALDTVVVRGLASAKAEPMLAVAESAAP